MNSAEVRNILAGIDNDLADLLYQNNVKTEYIKQNLVFKYLLLAFIAITTITIFTVGVIAGIKIASLLW